MIDLILAIFVFGLFHNNACQVDGHKFVDLFVNNFSHTLDISPELNTINRFCHEQTLIGEMNVWGAILEEELEIQVSRRLIDIKSYFTYRNYELN